MERYDPYNQSWCAISPALKYVSNFAATGCLGKLYLVGSCAVKYNALTLQCYNPVRGERLPQRHGSLVSDGEHGCCPAWLLRALSNSPANSRGAGDVFLGGRWRYSSSLACGALAQHADGCSLQICGA